MPAVRDLLSEWTPPGDIEARHEAEILLGHVLGRERAWLFSHAEFVPDAEAERRFREFMHARKRGEPVAYLIGHRGFWTFDLAVTPHVLIPRPETELLVELALERIPAKARSRVADLGTGSGAIALAIASERPEATLFATDASAAALEVARHNAGRLGIANVEFAPGNWCGALGTRQFDLIVANPPYIADGDSHLGQGDLRFEPVAALVSGEDGLDAIRAIVEAAPTHLERAGWLLFEHGYDQGERARGILALAGFQHIQTWRDIADNDRISGGQRG